MMAKRKIVASILLAGVLLIGCGKETNTYSEGLQEGFKTGYSEALFQYDKIAADSGKIVVYADKYGYLMGYHDGLAGNEHISEDEYETKFGYESFIIGYDQGYEDAIEGNDSLEDFGGALTWHNVSIDEGEIEETDMRP